MAMVNKFIPIYFIVPVVEIVCSKSTQFGLHHTVDIKSFVGVCPCEREDETF